MSTYEHPSEELRKLKQSLAVEINSEEDTSRVCKVKKRLLSWLKNTPVYLTLQWFDAVEEVTVSAKLRSKRWSTEITERDRMFLEKLGVGDG